MSLEVVRSAARAVELSQSMVVVQMIFMECGTVNRPVNTYARDYSGRHGAARG